ncbi:MAG TPA: hypothetical protein VIG06_16690 [Kofleriaceae bacterium]|jgi:hypothetical protein
MKITKRPDELLAAYADGGLRPDEAAEVEALLASSPEARAELEAIRRLLADARGAEAPEGEPDWETMARAIRRACDETPPSRFAWLWQPRRLAAIGGLAAAATAVVLVFALRGDRDGTEPRDGVVSPATAAAELPAPATASGDESDDALPGLREPEVDELSDDELADLDDELGKDDLGDEGFIADLLATPGAGTHLSPSGDEGDGFDVFDDDPLTADELADELPPDAIEKLDRFLAEVSAG